MVPGHINVDGDLIRQGSKLKMIHAGTGYNNVDLDACNEIGCYVAVTPNVAAQSVAELVFSSFAALKNQIRKWDNIMKDGGWKSSDFSFLIYQYSFWHPSCFANDTFDRQKRKRRL